MSSTNSGPAQTQTQNLQPLAGTFNADGTPAAIVGPGGVVVTRPFDPSSVAITGGVISLAASKTLAVNTLAVLGTSIENLTIGSDASNVYYSSSGALCVANMMMGWPWTDIGDFGVSGDTSGPSGANPGMTSRVDSIIAGGYGWCWVGFPINDVTNGAGLDPDTFTIPNMQAIYTKLLNSGIFVIAGTGGPTSAMSAVSAGATTMRVNYAKVQKAIRDFCQGKSGIVLANTALAMTDPATGLPFTSPATTIDGTHDNAEGAMRKALCIRDTMSGLVKPQDLLVENLFNYRNYAGNPYGLGDNASGTNGFIATTVTGTGPNGWGAGTLRTGAAVGSRAAVRASAWRQPQQGARLAITTAADMDGASFFVGGDDIRGLGRYDQAWAASTAYAYGRRVKPTVANGFHYALITPGTSGATQPIWPATEGDFVTDGTVTWMCQKTPTAGDTFYAECEIETSGLTASKGGLANLTLAAFDTSNTQIGLNAVSNFIDLTPGNAKPARYLPASMRLRTPVFTLGAGTLRYLRAQVLGVSEAGASFNLDVFRVDIIRI